MAPDTNQNWMSENPAVRGLLPPFFNGKVLLLKLHQFVVTGRRTLLIAYAISVLEKNTQPAACMGIVIKSY